MESPARFSVTPDFCWKRNSPFNFRIFIIANRPSIFLGAQVNPPLLVIGGLHRAALISTFGKSDYPQPVQNNGSPFVHLVTEGDKPLPIQRSSTVKKICLYLLGAALLAGVLANPPKMSADGTPRPIASRAKCASPSFSAFGQSCGFTGLRVQRLPRKRVVSG